MSQSMKCQIVKHNGILAIQINDTVYAPVSFKTFRPTDRNISDFYRAGMRLFNIMPVGIKSSIGIPYSLYGESWVGEETYDFDVIDKQIDFFIARAPKAYFSLMISLDTREWWLNRYVGYPNSFEKLAQMEADPYWRELAAKYMQAVMCHVEEKYEGRFYGYFLMAGSTTEWLSENSWEEPVPIVSEAYKEWMHDRTIDVPDRIRRESAEDVIFLEQAEGQNIVNYRRFEHWQRSDTIFYFAKKAQEILKHTKLLGIYYGYILELHGSRLYNTGHIGYEEVFMSDDINIFVSPISYDFRSQDTGSHQMLTNATLAMHNKLYFLEHDQTTCIVPDFFEGAQFAHPDKAKTVEADINLLRRDFMLALANNCAIWWFDMWSGWFYDRALMEEIGNMISVYNRMLQKGYEPVSEVAVVIDPESLYYVNKNSGLNDMLFCRQREGLSLMGAPYDIYSSCDIPRIDISKYKLFIFADQFKKNEAVDCFVSDAKKSGKTLLFIYAYDVMDAVYDPLSMCTALGMRLIKNPVKEESIVLEDGCVSDCGMLKPCFAVEDNTAAVLGRYQNSGKTAIGYKKQGDAVTVFSGLGNLNARALKKILALAGVHTYISDERAIVYINSNIMGIYHCREEDAVIALQEDAIYTDVFNNNKKYNSKNKTLLVPYQNIRAKLLIKP